MFFDAGVCLRNDPLLPDHLLGGKIEVERVAIGQHQRQVIFGQLLAGDQDLDGALPQRCGWGRVL